MTTEFDGQQALDQQLQQLQQLLLILEQEKEILIKSDPEQLTSIGLVKDEILLAIQSLDKQIEQSVQFRQGKAQGLYDNALAQIEQCLLQCKDQNTVNGKIIQQSQLAVERMKTSLLQSHNKSSLTYDNKGKTSGGLSSLDVKA
ncbi:flagellar export chaperone FlgN [Thalassotalea piscium]|uniref:Flagella synthesis protein FlgN n=1 Tax=Thalassotalea piscium TaxID=1230533 RepID=A0A7X0NJR8_9GAMM|nr:flagellar export chaperone FlgN [Thalassotalea piscium]MBB6544737.1 flagella synthesis protein FlgN [Thalassotalea piscium]